MKSPENTSKNAKKQQSTETKRIVNTKCKVGRVPVYTFSLTGLVVARTPATRQLSHWSGAFQTWTAASSFDRVTRHNRYDSANAGRSQRALSISAKYLGAGLTNRHIEIHGNSLVGSGVITTKVE